MSPAWYHVLCGLILVGELARPVGLIAYGAWLLARSLRGLARLHKTNDPLRR